MSDRHFLVRWPEVHRQTLFSRMHTSRLEKAGKHPLRVQLGLNSVAWWQDELDQFLASRPRGGPKQKPDLAAKRAATEPDPEAMARLHALLAEQAELLARLGLEAVPTKKPERKGRLRSGP
jgi:predicted DNA-binding transcriptional regulator AlpA